MVSDLEYLDSSEPTVFRTSHHTLRRRHQLCNCWRRDRRNCWRILWCSEMETQQQTVVHNPLALQKLAINLYLPAQGQPLHLSSNNKHLCVLYGNYSILHPDLGPRGGLDLRESKNICIPKLKLVLSKIGLARNRQ